MAPRVEAVQVSWRRRLPWIVGLAAAVVWIGIVSGLILGSPPRGAADPAELAQRTAAALTSGDSAQLAELLADPLDQDVAAASLDRLRDIGARAITASPIAPDLIEVHGTGDAGPFTFRLVATQADERWLLTALPPVGATG